MTFYPLKNRPFLSKSREHREQDLYKAYTTVCNYRNQLIEFLKIDMYSGTVDKMKIHHEIRRINEWIAEQETIIRVKFEVSALSGQGDE